MIFVTSFIMERGVMKYNTVPERTKKEKNMAHKDCVVNIEKGYYISWFVTTQAANLVTVTLADSAKTYFSESKQSTEIAPALASGEAIVDGDNLTLSIEVADAEALLGNPHSNDILTDSGNLAGKEYTLCLEDYTDNDYNDIAISIIGWKSKG